MNQAPGKFIDNPSFREYVWLLAELQRLIRDGRDESAEGEVIREAMDGPGDRLDSNEVKAVKLLAAEFASLSDRYGSVLAGIGVANAQIRSQSALPAFAPHQEGNPELST